MRSPGNDEGRGDALAKFRALEVPNVASESIFVMSAI